VQADGKGLWKSPVMSGLDDPKEIDLDVAGVQRLRLMVQDGGDGNSFDAANWCDAALHRE
jgi:alpha-galactosidase